MRETRFSKKDVKNILIAFLIFSPLFFFSIYYHHQRVESLNNNEVKTVGITYDRDFLGTGGTLYYFFKTPAGIYRGTTIWAHYKYPGYYYQVRYSSVDPTICELIEDSLIADSVGRKYILLSEIDPDHYVNKIR